VTVSRAAVMEAPGRIGVREFSVPDPEPGAQLPDECAVINPNSDICTRNVAVLGIGGETATAYEPSMRLMAAGLRKYPLDRLSRP
jgi:hypothetical protein